MILGEVGEDALLQQILPDLPLSRAVVAGAGDDCAVLRVRGKDELLLLKTDCIVQGVHFTADAKPREIGWKAMARPLSDFAAMSGLPEFALVTFIAPSKTEVKWTRDVYRGLSTAARAFEVAIVGGETSRIDGPVTISVSLSGWVEKERRVSRAGGQAGDELFVTGELGGSIKGKHLRFVPRIREARWLTKQFRIRAMMDLSDGLGADLPRLARASGVGFELEEAAIPRTRGCTVRQAISDGEDYELLFAISARDSSTLTRAWAKQFPKLRLTRIGRLIPHSAFRIPHSLQGYVHFQ
ncbi:MAG TPA: thiamine-phosphate kinase [Chthoniobacterales bacterium]|nr:thiamine-phosphate kinase [Chthoniobacterales bacterium]